MNELAEWLADQMNSISYEVFYEGPLGEKYKELMKKYDVPGKPFVWQVRDSLYMAVGIKLLMQEALLYKKHFVISRLG